MSGEVKKRLEKRAVPDRAWLACYNFIECVQEEDKLRGCMMRIVNQMIEQAWQVLSVRGQGEEYVTVTLQGPIRVRRL